MLLLVRKQRIITERLKLLYVPFRGEQMTFIDVLELLKQMSSLGIKMYPFPLDQQIQNDISKSRT